MVLELLTNPFKAEKHPAWLIGIGFLYYFVGAVIGGYFFSGFATEVMIFIGAAATIPLMYNLLRFEHAKADGRFTKMRTEIKAAGIVCAYLFVGFTLAILLKTLLFPQLSVELFKLAPPEGLFMKFVYSLPFGAITLLISWLAATLAFVPHKLTDAMYLEAKPWMMLPMGALYVFVGYLIGVLLFPSRTSLVFVFAATALSIPLIHNLMKYEEEKDYAEIKEVILLKEHGRAALAYFMLFVGATLAITALYVLVPTELIGQTFDAQIKAYNSINPSAPIVGNATNIQDFTGIFFNNFLVMVYCIIFSFLFGAGAIFILMWNASILGLAIGNKIRIGISGAANLLGLERATEYLSVSGHALILRYGIHGAIEMAAYIVAGIAGGIIGVAVSRHHVQTKKFEHIVMDTADLILIAIVLLFIGGLWEVWITKSFFL